MDVNSLVNSWTSQGGTTVIAPDVLQFVNIIMVPLITIALGARLFDYCLQKFVGR